MSLASLPHVPKRARGATGRGRSTGRAAGRSSHPAVPVIPIVVPAAVASASAGPSAAAVAPAMAAAPIVVAPAGAPTLGGVVPPTASVGSVVGGKQRFVADQLMESALTLIRNNFGEQATRYVLAGARLGRIADSMMLPGEYVHQIGLDPGRMERWPGVVRESTLGTRFTHCNHSFDRCNCTSTMRSHGNVLEFGVCPSPKDLQDMENTGFRYIIAPVFDIDFEARIQGRRLKLTKVGQLVDQRQDTFNFDHHVVVAGGGYRLMDEVDGLGMYAQAPVDLASFQSHYLEVADGVDRIIPERILAELRCLAHARNSMTPGQLRGCFLFKNYAPECHEMMVNYVLRERATIDLDGTKAGSFLRQDSVRAQRFDDDIHTSVRERNYMASIGSWFALLSCWFDSSKTTTVRTLLQPSFSIRLVRLIVVLCLFGMFSTLAIPFLNGVLRLVLPGELHVFVGFLRVTCVLLAYVYCGIRGWRGGYSGDVIHNLCFPDRAARAPPPRFDVSQLPNFIHVRANQNLTVARPQNRAEMLELLSALPFGLLGGCGYYLVVQLARRMRSAYPGLSVDLVNSITTAYLFLIAVCVFKFTPLYGFVMREPRRFRTPNAISRRLLPVVTVSVASMVYYADLRTAVTIGSMLLYLLAGIMALRGGTFGDVIAVDMRDAWSRFVMPYCCRGYSDQCLRDDGHTGKKVVTREDDFRVNLTRAGRLLYDMPCKPAPQYLAMGPCIANGAFHYATKCPHNQIASLYARIAIPKQPFDASAVHHYRVIGHRLAHAIRRVPRIDLDEYLNHFKGDKRREYTEKWQEPVVDYSPSALVADIKDELVADKKGLRGELNQRPRAIQRPRITPIYLNKRFYEYGLSYKTAHDGSPWFFKIPGHKPILVRLYWASGHNPAHWASTLMDMGAHAARLLGRKFSDVRVSLVDYDTYEATQRPWHRDVEEAHYAPHFDPDEMESLDAQVSSEGTFSVPHPHVKARVATVKYEVDTVQRASGCGNTAIGNAIQNMTNLLAAHSSLGATFVFMGVNGDDSFVISDVVDNPRLPAALGATGFIAKHEVVKIADTNFCSHELILDENMVYTFAPQFVRALCKMLYVKINNVNAKQALDNLRSACLSHPELKHVPVLRRGLERFTEIDIHDDTSYRANAVLLAERYDMPINVIMDEDARFADPSIVFVSDHFAAAALYGSGYVPRTTVPLSRDVASFAIECVLFAMGGDWIVAAADWSNGRTLEEKFFLALAASGYRLSPILSTGAHLLNRVLARMSLVAPCA